MLPRVAAAISQFIKPVSTTQDATEDSGKPKQDRLMSQSKKKAHLNLVPSIEDEPSPETGQSFERATPESVLDLENAETKSPAKTTPEKPPEKPKDKLNPMLALFQTLKSPGQALARKLRGKKSYSSGQGKKKTSLKKGGLVDDSIY